MTRKIVVLVIVVGLLAGVGWRMSVVMSARGKPTENVPETALVRTAKVARVDLDERVNFTGSIRPRNEVDVVSKVPGRIETLRAQVGDRVRVGQVLAVVEHKEIAWQAKTAEAAVRTAQAAVDGAKLEFDRAEALSKAGAVPAATFDGAKVRLSLAEAQLAQAQAGAGLAQQQVENATIVAPITGTITRRQANVGAQIAPGYPIYTIQDVLALKLEAGVDAGMFARLQRGMTAQLTVEELPEQHFGAKVTVLSPSLDATTRRASVELEIDNSSGKLMPNMFARASVVVGQLTQTLAVPRAAVYLSAGKPTVFRIQNGKAFELRPKLGNSDGDLIAVFSDLEEGDMVAVSGVALLTDGMPVKVAAATDGTEASPKRPQDGAQNAQDPPGAAKAVAGADTAR
jgi:RND family efflux transporter MFP subunit